jgi:hypothetical protein
LLSSCNEGETIPFSIFVPEDLTPSHRGQNWQLRWFFEVRIERGLRRPLRLRVPVRITRMVESEALQPQLLHPTPAPPPVGSERLTALSRRVGESCGFAVADAGLRASLGRCDLFVTRGLRDRQATLTGVIQYPALNLRLRLQAARPLGQPATLTPMVGKRPYWLAARDQYQAERFLASLQSYLGGFDEICMDDHRLRVRRRGARLIERALRLFCEQLLALARAFEAARRALRPPRPFLQLRPCWEYLRRELCGELDVGSMAIEGTLQQRAVRITTIWSKSGSPCSTRLSTACQLPLASEHCFVANREGQRPLDRLALQKARRLPEAMRPLVRELCDGARVLRISPTELSVDVAAPLSDSLWTLERLRLLVRLSIGLRPCRGPYR